MLYKWSHNVCTCFFQSIDMVKEEINLETRLTIDANEIKDHIPSDHARYHLFCLPHYYEGDEFKSIGKNFCTSYSLKCYSLSIINFDS